MKQEPKGQVPGIDLTFADGKTGRIWGVSGIGDLRGASFEKAAAYLEDRAEQDDVFDWIIEIDLDLVVSSAFHPLLNLISTLNRLVEEDADGGRSVKITWLISPGDDSMRTMAKDVKQHIDARRRSKHGLNIEIKEKGTVKPVRR
jgi:hypothetical protein